MYRFLGMVWFVDAEVVVIITATYSVTSQPVHARHYYRYDAIAWNHRHVDIISADSQTDVEPAKG